MTEFVNFIFHIMKISNFRHKLAFKQVVRFKVLQYAFDKTKAWCLFNAHYVQKTLKFEVTYRPMRLGVLIMYIHYHLYYDVTQVTIVKSTYLLILFPNLPPGACLSGVQPVY